MAKDTPVKVPLISDFDYTTQASWISALNQVAAGFEVCDLSELSKQARDGTQVAIVANPEPTQLAELPNLVWVQSLWAGVEKLMDESATSSFEVVRLVDDRLSETMAEAVLAWVYYLHRDMPLYHQQQAIREWRQWPVKPAKERSVGLLGFGALGRRGANKLSETGFTVRAWSRSAKQEDELKIEHFSGDDGLTEVLSQSEIVVILLPLTNQTEGLMNAHNLSALPRGAKLINFARGPIIDDNALIDSLNSGQLSHAVLDVFATEPLLESHAFWAHPNITVLPHISAPTDLRSASKIVVRNLANYLDQGVVPEAVSRSRGY